METDDYIYALEGAVQHYAWGGYEYIPALLGRDNPGRKPFAELWMGVHPRGVAYVGRADTERTPLDAFIARSPELLLGSRVSRRFNRQLPFLLKVLDVRSMLSIQVHPNKRQASTGFQQENARGIALDAPGRLFKDDNHKPEVMVALSDFWLLHGFRPVAEIRRLLREVPEFHPLRDVFSSGEIAALYRHVMNLPQADVNALLAPLAARLRAAAGDLTKDLPDYWALRAFEEYTSPNGDYDRGIFSIFLFNLVHLQPGEGIFQDAGVPHAYLEGVNVELMSNSDNVFRGGLTTKYVDVPALMDHLVFAPVNPRILHGQPVTPTERHYPTPAADFALSRIRIVPGQTHHQAALAAPQILLVLEGGVVTNDGQTFRRGESFFVRAGHDYTLRSAEEIAVLFKATVPAPSEPEVG